MNQTLKGCICTALVFVLVFVFGFATAYSVIKKPIEHSSCNDIHTISKVGLRVGEKIVVYNSCAVLDSVSASVSKEAAEQSDSIAVAKFLSMANQLNNSEVREKFMWFNFMGRQWY